MYDVVTKEALFEESDVLSVAWNSEFSDMFCYSSDGVITIKSGDFPSHRHHNIKGVAIGFAGSKIFCLDPKGVDTIDVPHSETLTNYITTDLNLALRVAFLGVTEADWKRLGNAALKALNLNVARSAFIRGRHDALLSCAIQNNKILSLPYHIVRDGRYLDLVEKVEEDLRSSNKENIDTVNQCSIAKVLAYQGHFQEASKLFSKAGIPNKAVELFSDLRKWDEAKAIAKQSDSLDVKQLVEKQAEW